MSYAAELHRAHIERKNRLWAVKQDPPEASGTEIQLLEPEIVPQILRQRIEIKDIIKAVCKRYKINQIDIFSIRRDAKTVGPRHIAMYLATRLTTQSYVAIGKLFGGRDHTTIIHAIRRIRAWIDEDAKFAAHINDMEYALRSKLPPNEDEIFFPRQATAKLWTAADVEYLKLQAAAGRYPSHVARTMRRTSTAVYNKAKKLGIPWNHKPQPTRLPTFSVESE